MDIVKKISNSYGEKLEPNFKSNLDCMIFFWDLDLIQKPNFYHKIIFIGAATMQLTNKIAKEKKPSK